MFHTKLQGQASMRGARHTTSFPRRLIARGSTPQYVFSLSKRDSGNGGVYGLKERLISEDDIRASLETLLYKCVNFYEHALKLVQSTFKKPPERTIG
jgi:hypothetical protein